MTGHRSPGLTLESPSPVKQRENNPIETALLTLLGRHPKAIVFAVSADNTPRPIPLPDAVPVQDHELVDGTRSLLNEVAPSDRIVVAKLWGQARSRGIAVGPIRRVGQTEPSNLYLLDLRAEYQAIIGIVTDGSSTSSDTIVDAARLPLVRPRFARAVKDASAVITWVDPALSLILGWAPEELIGRRTIELIHPDDQELGIAAWMETLGAPEHRQPVRLRHRHRDGSWIWLEVTNQNRLDDEEHGDVLAEMLDVSEAMATIEALHAREQLLGQLTETVPVGLFHVDLSGNLLFANQRLHELTGVGPSSTLAEQWTSVEGADRIDLEESLRAATGGAETDVEIRIHGGDADTRHCRLSIRPLRDESGTVTGLTGCVEDVTASVHTRNELEARAVSDPLTGCLNRTATLTTLQELLDRPPSGLSPAGTAVIFVDLDRFKAVNDQLGHAVGDQVLLRVTERIRASVRSGDILGRLGGDEFVVICPGVSNSAHALHIARSLASRAFESEVDLPGTTVVVQASIGVAWTDLDGVQAAALVGQADAAMYHSKREGRAEPAMFVDSTS
jgi:diguanylate cyclase (GGDEF)-like protein/PAS domain S-box-containing protein